MDQSERQALAFLASRGLGTAKYEPRGKSTPPDFAINELAIEVRRLNQHDENGKGLEVRAVPLQMKVQNLLTSLGPAQGASWFVMFRYRRPIERWATLSKKITAVLSDFARLPQDGYTNIAISKSFSLSTARASRAFPTRYVLGGYTDQDSGGFVAAELIRNLNIVIPKKTAKIEKARGQYSEWWLVLIDHISLGRLDPHELDAVRQHVVRDPAWQKIILVSPVSPDVHSSSSRAGLGR